MQYKKDKTIMEAYAGIMAADMPDVDKVRDAFELITDAVILHSEHEIELLRAMSDRDNLVKAQIKLSTVKWARGILAEAYTQATGRKA